MGETTTDTSGFPDRHTDPPPEPTEILLSPGQVTGRVTTVVEQADTAQAIGSGDVPVLGTPRVLALAEAATVSALTRRIPTSLSSVGVAVTLEHVAAVGLGERVTVDVILQARSGSRLDFEFTVTDAAASRVAEGTITRRLVHREAFLTRVRGRQ